MKQQYLTYHFLLCFCNAPLVLHNTTQQFQFTCVQYQPPAVVVLMTFTYQTHRKKTHLLITISIEFGERYQTVPLSRVVPVCQQGSEFLLYASFLELTVAPRALQRGSSRDPYEFIKTCLPANFCITSNSVFTSPVAFHQPDSRPKHLMISLFPGLCCWTPTHGFNRPWCMFCFILLLYIFPSLSACRAH